MGRCLPSRGDSSGRVAVKDMPSPPRESQNILVEHKRRQAMGSQPLQYRELAKGWQVAR